MRVIGQSVKILAPENGEAALKAIEYAGRNCYRSQDRINDNSAPDFVRSLIRRGHLSPLEFADMTVEQITSRDVMAEITRHRLANFCIESQRYVSMDGQISFVYPICCKENKEVEELWREAMKDAEEAYHWLQDIGCKAQDARKVQPNSCATRIVMKANLREWRHILSIRTGKGVYPEMKELMAMQLIQAKAHIPVVFDDLEAQA